MRTQGGFWCGLSALALLSIGCGQGAVGESSFTTISGADADELPYGCDAVLDTADDEELSWARVAANEVAIVIDSPDGSCVDDSDHVLEVLNTQQRFDLAAHIVAGFHEADPSPHPDLNGGVMADPSPHPDKPTDVVEADPSPHPDKPSDDDDDGIAVVIVIQIGTGGGTGGTGAPAGPAPAPPTPGKDD